MNLIQSPVMTIIVEIQTNQEMKLKMKMQLRMITDEIINESMVDMNESGSDKTAYSTEDDRNS